MRISLDTNRYVDLIAAVPETVEIISQAEEILVPFVVLAELHDGFLGGNRKTRNVEVLNRFLDLPIVDVVFADAQTVGIWAELSSSLRRKGISMPHNDIWIAAISIQNGARLYTRDSHFDHMPQVLKV